MKGSPFHRFIDSKFLQPINSSAKAKLEKGLLFKCSHSTDDITTAINGVMPIA